MTRSKPNLTRPFNGSSYTGASTNMFICMHISLHIVATSCAQLMPSDHSYAHEFNSLVKNAIIK